MSLTKEEQLEMEALKTEITAEAEKGNLKVVHTEIATGPDIARVRRIFKEHPEVSVVTVGFDTLTTKKEEYHTVLNNEELNQRSRKFALAHFK
ncbi:hypothetical protein ACFL4H_00170 [Candidatus Neomarinimicrobiota bacterium]